MGKSKFGARGARHLDQVRRSSLLHFRGWSKKVGYLIAPWLVDALPSSRLEPTKS